jgi:hypothetical protein
MLELVPENNMPAESFGTEIILIFIEIKPMINLQSVYTQQAKYIFI